MGNSVSTACNGQARIFQLSLNTLISEPCRELLTKKRPSFPKAAWLLRDLILRMRGRGRGRRHGRCAAVALVAADVHDDAGAFPRLNGAFAGVRAVELQH